MKESGTVALLRRKLNGKKRWGAFCWDQAQKPIGKERAESWESKAVVIYAEILLLTGDLIYRVHEQFAAEMEK
ncbi:hypothetical protein BV53_03010 [Candidatus Synechococcus spongiarum LMB bulk15N]|uniref:Uncharacterized protein n=2 Tax=Candidatus Synechococcus spongiarum TaxID=431041 RepID=A0A1T1D4J8_9SYNE|nr:hypothetical protein BV53_03010 [Candidatus Synechococcus spongiarum LMB bulk15N]